MIYQYEDKFYVKVGQNYVQIEMVFSDDDVTLRPTNIKLDKIVELEGINFLKEKARLLAEHNADKIVEIKEDEQETIEEVKEIKEVKPMFNYDKKNKKYSK